jgi:large subunit ribosomal protein L3
MPVGLLGRKIGMTQIHDADGNIIPVTVVEAGPCAVLQVRTKDRDGYEAVQLGFADKPRRLASRAERGHVKALPSKRQKQLASAGAEATPKAETEPKRMIREFRTDGEQVAYEIGQSIDVSIFAEVTHVDVCGVSKGRGFTGCMKRHNFSGQGASHGVKRVHRRPGSNGMSADPSRVFKGKRMPGHYGNEQVTVRNLKVVRIEADSNVLVVRGAVPGANGSYLMIHRTNKV